MLKHINAIVLIIFNLKNAHFVFQANKVGKIKYISYIYLNLKYFFLKKEFQFARKRHI